MCDVKAEVLLHGPAKKVEVFVGGQYAPDCRIATEYETPMSQAMREAAMKCK